jgi:hypothetical protein
MGNALLTSKCSFVREHVHVEGVIYRSERGLGLSLYSLSPTRKRSDRLFVSLMQQPSPFASYLSLKNLIS